MKPKFVFALFISTCLPCSSASAMTAPDIQLPAQGVVFAVHDGAVTRLHHASIRVNQHAGSNTAKMMFAPMMLKMTSTLEIEGASSAIHVSGTAEIYMFYPVRREQEQEGDSAGKVQLLKIHGDGNRRIVGALAFSRVVGSPTHVFAAQDCKIERVDENWVRLTPAVKLAPGEYAIAIVPERKNVFEDEVYDFAVDEK